MPSDDVTMKCPFAPCLAELAPLRHRTDPYDASKTIMVYPIHEVVGQGSWFGRCPASQLIVPFLTAAGRQVLSDSNKQYMKRYAERINAEAERIREQASQLVHDAIDEATRPDRPTPPSVEDYFPGRPADAPEPGAGEPPATVLPPTQIGYPAGRAEDMSTQEQHVAMIAAARSAIGEAQETMAVAVAAIEALEAAVSVLPPKVTAAHALVHAAVGSASNLPDPAIAMRANITAALDTITGEGNIAGAVLLVRARLGSLAAQLSAASTNGATYAAMPK